MDVAKIECSKMTAGKPRISVVWKYFKMDSEDKSKVVCQICEEQLKFSGSTTSMKYHLTRHSSLISLNIGLPPSKSKHSIKAGFKPSSLECGSSGGRQDAMTASLVNMCLMDLIPTTVVDGQGFRQFLHYVEPGYAFPSHQVTKRKHCDSQEIGDFYQGKVPRIQRKWTESEENQVIQYLLNTVASGKPIEKPTAEVYYQKLLQRLNFGDCTVSQLKGKVKHVKKFYTDAVTWRSQAGHEVRKAEGEEAFKRITLQKCPKFEQLDEIFGSRSNGGQQPAAFCGDSPHPESDEVVLPDLDSRDMEELYSSSSSSSSQDMSPGASSARAAETRFAAAGVEALADAMNQKTAFGHRRLDFDFMRLDFEKQKWDSEVKLKARELELEEKRIENGFLLSRYELELKYKAQALNRRISALYESRRCLLLSELRHCQDVTISVERWTAAGEAAFLTVATHFVTADWEFQSRVLGSETLAENPTAEAIAEVVSSSVRSYGIGDQSVVAVIHAGDQEVAQSYALLGWHHFPCFARTLGHCVTAALEVPSVAALTAACRDVVDCVLGCPALASNIEARQRAEGAPRRRLLRDVQGHWPSTFRMMEAVHEQRRIVFEVMRETLEHEAFPRSTLRSEGDWTRVGAVLDALRPLDTVREMLSAEPHVILSTVVPVLFSLVSVHLKPDDADEEVVRELKQVVVREMKSQFSFDSNAFPESFGIMTTVLDPRHKSLPFLNELQRATVRAKLTALVEENRAAVQASEEEEGAAAEGRGPRFGRDEDSDEEVAAKRPRTTVAEFLGPIYGEGPGAGVAGPSRTRSEVESYLQEMPASLTSDPLTWWKLCGYKYPSLAKLARRMLCIPATAAPPAQAFAGPLDPERLRRAALDPAIAPKVLFLSRNGELPNPGSGAGEFPLMEEAEACFAPQVAMLAQEALAEGAQGAVGPPPQ